LGAPLRIKRDYRDYLRFLDAGPLQVTDAEVCDILDLPRYAAAAAFFQPPKLPRQTLRCPSDGDPVGTAWQRIETAFAAACPNTVVPALLVCTGRIYAEADFSSYLGEFSDVLPVVLGGGLKPADIIERLNYLRDHHLVVTNLLGGQLGGMLPQATQSLSGDFSQWPIINLLMTPPSPDLVSHAPGQPHLITVNLSQTQLEITGLPVSAAAGEEASQREMFGESS